MSMYNTLFGFDPLAHPLLMLLKLNPIDIPRFRDCYLCEGKILIYTRTGGGNRELNATPWTYEGEIIPKTTASESFSQMCAGHPDFLGAEDDDYDSTYLLSWFQYPDEYKDSIAEVAQKHEKGRPAARWKDNLEAMKSGQAPMPPGLQQIAEEIKKSIEG